MDLLMMWTLLMWITQQCWSTHEYSQALTLKDVTAQGYFRGQQGSISKADSAFHSPSVISIIAEKCLTIKT